MENILTLASVIKYYGTQLGHITKAVDGISLSVDKGEFTAIRAQAARGKQLYSTVFPQLIPSPPVTSSFAAMISPPSKIRILPTSDGKIWALSFRTLTF